MADRLPLIRYWSPRVLMIIYAIFISIFALDVLGAEYSVGELLVALFMHLIPTYLIVAFGIVAWRWPRWGGLLFILLAIGFTLFFNTYREVATLLLLSLPPLVIGILFLSSGSNRQKRIMTNTMSEHGVA